MPIEPYLFFNGRCEEAIDFYKKALGAESRFSVLDVRHFTSRLRDLVRRRC